MPFGMCNHKWGMCNHSTDGMHKCHRPHMHFKNKDNNDHWCGNASGKKTKCGQRLKIEK